MTSERRFDQDLPALLVELYPATVPDYRDDLFRQTARIAQRPAWSFLTRWIPMDVAAPRLPVARLPLRSITFAVVILLLLAATVIVVVGSRPRVPSPFGPARNGPIAYSSNGDIFTRETLDAPARLLIQGTGTDAFPIYSPDGLKLEYAVTSGGQDVLMVADADGRNAVRVVPDALLNAQAAPWSPDSRSIAVITDVGGVPTLLIAAADGTGARRIDLGTLTPSEVSWRPPDGATLLIRAKLPTGQQDYYSLRPDGSERRPLGLPSPLEMGSQWDVSGAAWSPAGDRFAYNAVEPDATTAFVHFRVHVRNADGSRDVALPGPAANVHEAWPQFSPDGRWILVHRWTWSRDAGGTDDGEGWLAVMPADGSAAARDIGPRIKGGEHTGLIETWSPDGSRVLVRAENTQDVFAIDPFANTWSQLPWAGFDLPDVQRLAP